jgi:hypothetical protein
MSSERRLSIAGGAENRSAIRSMVMHVCNWQVEVVRLHLCLTADDAVVVKIVFIDEIGAMSLLLTNQAQYMGHGFQPKLCRSLIVRWSIRPFSSVLDTSNADMTGIFHWIALPDFSLGLQGTFCLRVKVSKGNQQIPPPQTNQQTKEETKEQLHK